MLSVIKNVWVYALVAAIATMVTAYLGQYSSQQAALQAATQRRQILCQDALASRQGYEITGVRTGDAYFTVAIIGKAIIDSEAYIKTHPEAATPGEMARIDSFKRIIAQWNQAKADIAKYC